MAESNYMTENSNIGICVGSILGINKYSWNKSVRYIVRVTDVSGNHISGLCQSTTGKSTLNVYSSEQIIKLPLTEELLDSTAFFHRVDNEWKSPNDLVVISNSEEFEKKWNIKIFDDKHNLIFYSIFDYVHELQFFCYLHKVDLDLKYGTVRVLYQDYIDSI